MPGILPGPFARDQSRGAAAFVPDSSDAGKPSLITRSAQGGASLAVRSLLWALLLPGVVAGYLPWRYFGVRSVRLQPGDPLHIVGVLSIGVGVVLLAWCIFAFAQRGRGTLSPADPPSVLVVQGLYRYVRNPMYLAVSTIILGEATLTRSAALLVYWLVFFVTANVFVMGFEEPKLRRQFGATYDEYTRRVGRWLPR